MYRLGVLCSLLPAAHIKTTHRHFCPGLGCKSNPVPTESFFFSFIAQAEDRTLPPPTKTTAYRTGSSTYLSEPTELASQHNSSWMETFTPAQTAGALLPCLALRTHHESIFLSSAASLTHRTAAAAAWESSSS